MAGSGGGTRGGPPAPVPTKLLGQRGSMLSGLTWELPWAPSGSHSCTCDVCLKEPTQQGNGFVHPDCLPGFIQAPACRQWRRGKADDPAKPGSLGSCPPPSPPGAWRKRLLAWGAGGVDSKVPPHLGRQPDNPPPCLQPWATPANSFCRGAVSSVPTHSVTK